MQQDFDTAPEIPGVEGLESVRSGADGAVFRGVQVPFGRPVAVKILNRRLVDAGSQHRFNAEAQALGALTGIPGIVQVHTSGITSDGFPYITMEYCGGGSLSDAVVDRGLSDREAVQIGVRLADALHLAHQQGIVHRDVKPSNILLTESDDVRLADFGISRVGADEPAERRATPAHAAPEVLEGEQAGPDHDVYSLASTLYTLLARRAPFVSLPGERVDAYIRRKRWNTPPTVPGVNRALSDVLVRAMSADRSVRFSSAEQFGRALRELDLSSNDAGSDVPSRRMWPAVLVGALVLVLGVAGLATLFWPDSDRVDVSSGSSSGSTAVVTSSPSTAPAVETTASTARPASTTTTDPKGVVLTTLAELKQGDCLDIPGAELNYSRLPVVDCGRAHNAEVDGVVAIEAATFPSESDLGTWDVLKDKCTSSFAARDPAIIRTKLVPNEGDWELGFRQIACVAFVAPVEGVPGT